MKKLLFLNFSLLLAIQYQTLSMQKPSSSTTIGSHETKELIAKLSSNKHPFNSSLSITDRGTYALQTPRKSQIDDFKKKRLSIKRFRHKL